ncbi:signal peptide containing protein [Theileria equi strain WA]|uniref:Signal peptide containing protein n=1 Tax=Theileria equi strain WA TaxID=1537102 RepID=L1LDP7_THEEQ|nr:signal peptide containing protein [Theileria equi strain WA]EKX73370.1 signal peptide containing protein [Theileria equi strain WA]|eukprot:XP_004832822.1 signal peptide containing protein [Theileria equi strain WA]
MKVFSILLTTCLLGLCHCKRSKFITDRPVIEVLDDYAEDEIVTSDLVEETETYESAGRTGKKQVWDMANGTVYEEYFTGLEKMHSTDVIGESLSEGNKETKPVEHLPAEVAKANTESVSSSELISLHVANLDPSICDSFYYTVDDVPTKFIVSKDVNVNRLLTGQNVIWKAPQGEKVVYTKLFLKNNKPKIVKIASANPKMELKYKIFCNKNGKWEDCLASFKGEMKKLKVPVERKGDFTISTGDTKDTDKCKIFDATILGMTSRFYFPKPGYVAKEIKDGAKSIWKATKADGMCTSFTMYLNIEPPLIILIHKDGNNLPVERFAKISGEWKKLSKEEFGKRLQSAKAKTGQQTP